MRAIIMAGGDDSKWGGYLGVRRHFAPVDGEPLLHRTVRQLLDREAEVFIVAPDLPEYHISWTTLIEPETTAWGEEALNAQHFWAERDRTVQFYGDVVFTDAAMNTIVGYERRVWQAFGRMDGARTKPYGELFAISFWPEHHAEWMAALWQAFELKRTGIIHRAGSWEAFRIMGGAQGYEAAVHSPYPDLMTEILDGTDDFDTPAEYEALMC